MTTKTQINSTSAPGRGRRTRTVDESRASRQESTQASGRHASRLFYMNASRVEFTKSRFRRNRIFSTLAICAAITAGGVTLAQHSGKNQVKTKNLNQRAIIEKLDGKDASATVKEVIFEPGQEDSSHRHAGPVFGYVLEGEYEHALDNESVKIYKAGETFYEPTGSLHRVARNPNTKTRTRLLAVILHPRDVKEVTVRENSRD